MKKSGPVFAERRPPLDNRGIAQVYLFCLRRTDIPETLLLIFWCCLTLCNGNTRKGKSSCVHTTLIHCAPRTLRGLVLTEAVMSPSTIQWLAELYQ